MDGVLWTGAIERESAQRAAAAGEKLFAEGTWLPANACSIPSRRLFAQMISSGSCSSTRSAP